jgi:hypothetical protein
MITEMDRAIALMLICSRGPLPEQIAEKRLSKAQVAYGNEVLRAAAKKLREGLHNTIPDAMVKRVIAGDHDG